MRKTMFRRKKTPRRIDPFEPQPRREDVRGALFWPDTLFVDLSAYPDEFQSYEPDDLRVWEQGDPGILVAAAARTHEQMHWLQLAGTTFGRFQAINRLTTGDLAEAIFNTATPAEIERLSDGRRAGLAPGARDRDGQLVHKRHSYSVKMQGLFDHWWASVALDHYLTDGGAALLGRLDPRFMVGLGLRYATADRPRDVFNASDFRFFEDTIATGPNDGRVPPITSGLTVRHIEETAAMVAQHLCNAGFAEQLPPDRQREYASRVLAWTLERFIDDRHSLYTRALSHFAEHAPEVSAKRFLELALLVCDLALNPVIPDTGEPLACAWTEFHPVCRFERIVASLDTFAANIAKVDGDAPMSWWADERERIAVHAGVRDGASSDAFCKPSALDADPLEDPGRHLRGFLGQAGRNLALLRARFPAAVPSAIHALRCDADGMVAALAQLQGPSFDPPMNIKSFGDGEPSASIDHAAYGRCLTAVTERRAAHSWLVRSGPLNFAGLPTDALGRMVQNNAATRLRNGFDLTD